MTFKYRAVLAIENLPSSFTGSETRAIDFKSEVDPSAWWELAKDLAAFANHIGGTLVIGAVEQPDGAPTYEGISLTLATKIRAAYESAALKHCSPSPVVLPAIIPLADKPEHVVLAINVEPFAGQPVGSMAKAVNKNGDPCTSKAFLFPLRVGRETQFLTPDKLAMLIDPHIRRMVIMLEAIPQDPPQGIHILWRHPRNDQTEAPVETPLRRVDDAVIVDVSRNVVQLEAPAGRIGVPLDDVDAVWEASTDRWHIMVRGMIAGPKYTTNPRNTTIRRQ